VRKDLLGDGAELLLDVVGVVDVVRCQPDCDIDGDRRPLGGAPDAGADELVPSSP